MTWLTATVGDGTKLNKVQLYANVQWCDVATANAESWAERVSQDTNGYSSQARTPTTFSNSVTVIWERMVTILVAYVSVHLGSFLIHSTNPRWAADMGGWRWFLAHMACQHCIWRMGTWQCLWACMCMHACLEHQKLKTVLPRVQVVVRGHPLSAVCCPRPLRSSACSCFTQQTEGIIFSRVNHRRAPSHQSTSCSRNRELHKSTRRSGKTQSAQPPMKHLPHTCRELSQSRESGQFVDSCLPRREVLIISWGWCEVVSGLSQDCPTPSLFIPSLSLCLTGQSECLWRGCLPMSRQVLNIWCVPSGIGSLLMVI